MPGFPNLADGKNTLEIFANAPPLAMLIPQVWSSALPSGFVTRVSGDFFDQAWEILGLDGKHSGKRIRADTRACHSSACDMGTHHWHPPFPVGKMV